MLLNRRRISAQCFDQLWGIFRCSIVSELSSPASSPFQPLVKPTLCASDSIDDTFCHSCPVQPLRCKYLRCNLETIKFLWTTLTFYTNYFAVTTPIIIIINCVASDIRYLRKFGAYLKNYVASHPDGMNVQHLKYFIQKLLQVLTCRPIRKCVLFRIQSILSY